ncbi:RING finger protein 112-like isoform X2 [Tachyglossus aculeatus]|nr:RING finger protein 112-like isoform X2 [Tachyglossus aculeatus]
MGVEPTTRGLWICSKPFILKGKSAKEVAVFLVDTEGTMDVAGNKENSVKISTLNMLFSSYLILNVNEILQEPELEYLEMSLDLINDAFQDHVQNLHLDILVRDWFNSDECNEKQGKEYLKGIVKRIQGNKKFPTVVKLLKSTKAEVHLLPSPGSKITRSTCGTLDEMDPVFKDCFLKYIGLLHSKAKEYTKSKMKCRDLAKLIKEIAGIIENTSYNISSPAEMRKVILELQKKRFVDDFCEWMKTKISQTNYVGCYFTRPSKMKSQFEEEFKNRCKKVKINEETQNYMKKEMDSYLEDYKANFYRKNLSTGLPVVALGAMTLHFHLQD